MRTAPDAALVGNAKGGDVAAFEAILGSAIEPAYRPSIQLSLTSIPPESHAPA